MPVLRVLTWLISLAIHGSFALLMYLPAGGSALHEGAGEDIMVIEQGIAIEGFAKLGEDLVSVEPIEAPPVEAAAAQPLPEEVEPVEEDEVITSTEGPEQDDIKEPEEEVIEQPLPPQIATVQQDSVVAMRESSGQELKGGDATARSAYLGKLRTHLERSKINPRTNYIGTAVVRFKVSSAGELLSREIVTSSGNKVLDDAAIASVEKGSPYPPIPDSVNRDHIEISVPFRFSIR